MLRPRGKASRIFKNIFSLGDTTLKKKQGYKSRLDESLGMKNRRMKSKQPLKARRDESEGMEESMKRRPYASVKTMDKARRKKK